MKYNKDKRFYSSNPVKYDSVYMQAFCVGHRTKNVHIQMDYKKDNKTAVMPSQVRDFFLPK